MKKGFQFSIPDNSFIDFLFQMISTVVSLLLYVYYKYIIAFNCFLTCFSEFSRGFAKYTEIIYGKDYSHDNMVYHSKMHRNVEFLNLLAMRFERDY